jgi:catechol 2,3-dioxygenase-like lactoylglutathione lyase family enzyme
MRLRQVALVARDLEAVVGDCCAVLGLEVAFRDPEIAMFGLRNALMPIGDTFLEVVSPVREDATAARFLQRRGGDGGYMVIVQTDDLEAARTRLSALGVRVVFEVAFDDVATLHLHPRDVGGAILSLDVARPPESWRWAGPVWRDHVRTDVSAVIAGVGLQAADPGALAARWSAILERPSRENGPGAYVIPLDDGVIRFVRAQDERGDGVAGLDVRLHDRARAFASAHARGLATTADTVTLGGIRVRLC